MDFMDHEACARRSNAEVALALLSSGETPVAEIREIVNDIKVANLRANEVLGLTRDFLRKRDVRMEPLDLNAAICEMLVLTAGDARKRRVQIRTELGKGLPPVLGNRTQIQQVLINLVVNGMDAMSNTPDGKRRITITTTINGDGHIEVAVADCGVGVQDSEVPHLFEPFFTTRSEGMGLGLSVVRSIVETHQGRLWVDNNSDGGATFHFTLPIAIPLQDAVTNQATTATPDDPG